MMRKIWASGVLVFGLLLSGASGVSGAAAESCAENRVTLRGPSGQASFAVEIADTDAERATGLMHRAAMPRFSGMLFVFEAPQRAVFWMENTLIPLDMLFLDDAGVVQRLHRNAIPLDRTGIDGGDGIRYVLEINGGMSDVLGLDVGAELRHPVIDQETAAWPCN
ncbi:DUF192 domain-containing protein [Pararhodobacter sp.]|uniref:DUF192 domain-containing protein n=1 Tax=Pararhodobacter sp. TaxID=2127056 RepID=UPI002AFE9F31|nr:DUF192 domain-containing protein [Pararhodobacter sp.]